MDENHGKLRLIMKFTFSVDEEIGGVIQKLGSTGEVRQGRFHMIPFI